MFFTDSRFLNRYIIEIHVLISFLGKTTKNIISNKTTKQQAILNRFRKNVFYIFYFFYIILKYFCCFVDKIPKPAPVLGSTSNKIENIFVVSNKFLLIFCYFCHVLPFFRPSNLRKPSKIFQKPSKFISHFVTISKFFLIFSVIFIQPPAHLVPNFCFLHVKTWIFHIKYVASSVKIIVPTEKIVQNFVTICLIKSVKSHFC